MAPRLTPTTLVLDSWPILEWFKGRQPAATRFEELTQLASAGKVQLSMCRLNYGEVCYLLRKAPDIFDRSKALAALAALPIQLHSVDDALVDEAVALKSRYRFSYADAFAAALAMRLQVPLATGDREFRTLEADGLLQIEWVGA